MRVTTPPRQKETGPEAVTVGLIPTVESVTTLGEEVILTPLEFVTFTVYEPGEVTVIERVVAPPGAHKYAEPELAVNTTLPPEQKVSGPLAEIVAVARMVFGISS